jgi:K(+)-stimulated pyrophosphate-energized sodium pump
MNMVSLLTLGLVMQYNVIAPTGAGAARAVGFVISFVAISAIIWAVWQSKRETPEMMEFETQNQ